MTDEKTMTEIIEGTVEISPTSYVGTEELLKRIEVLEQTVSDIQLTIQHFVSAAVNATKEAKELVKQVKELNARPIRQEGSFY